DIEKVTKAPAKMTTEMLSNYLKNPFKNDLIDDEEEDYKAILEGLEIGTEATRTGVIENAKKYEYISENKSVLSIEPKGIKLIEILEKLNIDLYKEKTVEFSKILKKVYKDE
ncbi:DNA topoisomerase, partial [Clostridium perfringens]|uniref:DNA topoisomerase n=1 Tax=Clostridium perfringens TaxID=1502 RepID=UPI002245AFB4